MSYNHKKLTLMISLVLLLQPNLLAWSGKGHALVAELAESHLTPATRAEVRELLGNQTLASISDCRHSRERRGILRGARLRPSSKKWLEQER
jgi:hypothetical protein